MAFGFTKLTRATSAEATGLQKTRSKFSRFNEDTIRTAVKAFSELAQVRKLFVGDRILFRDAFDRFTKYCGQLKLNLDFKPLTDMSGRQLSGLKYQLQSALLDKFGPRFFHTKFDHYGNTSLAALLSEYATNFVLLTFKLWFDFATFGFCNWAPGMKRTARWYVRWL